MTVKTKQDAARVLSNVEGDKRFFCHDGCIIDDLQHLGECLAHMNDDSLNYHMTSEKNDFSRWIGDVLGDDKLAKDVRNAQNRLEAVEVVKARIAWLEKKANK